MANTSVPDMTWFHSRPALAVKAVIALILSYVAGSRALDTGSYWQYLGTVTLLIFGIKFIVRAVHNTKK